jgi:uncharacterized ferritin-like protein (DUF455 family)
MPVAGSPAPFAPELRPAAAAPTDGCTPGSVREFCLTLLESGDLASKLRPPRRDNGAALGDDEPGPAVSLDRPARTGRLRLTSGAPPLPGVTRLSDPAARRLTLERFAHHELMAVELFAWALVTWPGMPPPLRRGLLGLLEDEQRHLRLYLERLDQLGSELGETPLSGYLWRSVPAIRASQHGPIAFLCAMGLTFEQANLDFARLYATALERAGDAASAAVVDRVHRDEIGHVRLALEWLRRLKPPGSSDLAAYRDMVPFPLGPSRAKGREFDARSRREAGLDDEFIEHVRLARPYGRPPRPA